jgi:uncharacterized protein (DUF58 family)
MIPKEILKKVRRIHIRTKHMVTDVFAGEYHSVFKGQGMEFQEVREYVPGDEIRSIDWNVTARMGHPFVKKFTEERELTIMLLVDISASNTFGSTPQLKKDLAAEVAAVLAFAAIANNDRVGLILFTDRIEGYIPPKKGLAHVLRVIREVLYFQPAGRGTRIEPALGFLNRVTTRKTVSFLVSDFLSPESLKKPLAVTGRRHDLISVVIGDKREQAWPGAGLVEWADAETGRRYLADTADARTRRVFGEMQARRRNELLALLRASRIDTVQVNAGEPYEREFVKFFRMRERRLKT